MKYMYKKDKNPIETTLYIDIYDYIWMYSADIHTAQVAYLFFFVHLSIFISTQLEINI